MKCTTALIALFGVAFALPEAPYPPSGYKPAGQQFNLPQKTYGPSNTYPSVPETTEEPESEPANNSSRLLLLTNQPAQYNQLNQRAQFNQLNQRPAQYNQLNQRSTQYIQQQNQDTPQFYVISNEGSVRQFPNQFEQPAAEPDSEQVSGISNIPALGQLVRLPVSSGQLGASSSGRVPTSSQSARLVSAPVTNQLRKPSAQFFALTSDGRLQPAAVQQEEQVKQSAELKVPSALVLTPEGRFERVPIQSAAQTGQAAQLINSAQVTQAENGEYYLILPSGKLQHVQFMNQLSPENRLTSNVEYNDVQPIRGPIYSYGAPLVRVV